MCVLPALPKAATIYFWPIWRSYAYVCMHSWKFFLLLLQQKQQKQQALSFLCVIACCWTHITEFYIGNDSSPMFTTKNTDVLIVYDGSIGPTKNSSVTIGLRTRLKLRSFRTKFGLHRLPNIFQIHRFASLRSQKITIRLCLIYVVFDNICELGPSIKTICQRSQNRYDSQCVWKAFYVS